MSTGALPAGLTLNPATGAISGTPTTAGMSTFTLRLTDATKPTALSATKTLSITVSPKLSAAVFVGNSGNNSLTSYTVGASGDAHPLTTVAGSSTTLSGTEGVAIDRNGTVYVVSADNDEIAEFTDGLDGQHRTACRRPGTRHRADEPDRGRRRRFGPPVCRQPRRRVDHRVRAGRPRRRGSAGDDLRTRHPAQRAQCAHHRRRRDLWVADASNR